MDKEFILQLETVPDIYGGEAHSLLEKRAENGAKRRFGKIDIAIKNRLLHELELIWVTNTAKLFLHWTDVIAKIKQKTYPYIYSVHNCSLVAFCLGVAEAFFGIPKALIDVAKLYLDDYLLRLAENIGKEWESIG